MGRSDEDLMLSYRGGNEAAFEMLYRRYERPLLNFMYRIVMNTVDAENLCQETFFRIVRAKKKYEATAKFKTWLFQIALNLCRDRRRRMKHRSHLSLNTQASSQNKGNIELQELISDPSSNLEKHVETEELEALVQGAIKCLPEEEHFVVVLKEYQGIKFSEIANIMNCPIGTVKSLNHRAHKKLRKILAKYIGD
jgi:RNA polymerase sigma-70 factor (ECF subfamily)